MSMLSSQADELRLMARLVRDYDYKEISRMLREAADTIESLRDRLQPVPAELDCIEDKSRWFQLFGTPERAARTLHHNGTLVCRECLIREECAKTPEDSDCMIARHDVLLEWLEGEAE